MPQPSCAPDDQDGRTAAPDTPWAGLALPSRIGDRFTLDELIGRGPCSEVWSATDTLLDRPATVKIFAVTGDHRAGMRVLAGLDHPHLVSVYDVGDITDADGSRAYVVTAPMDGSLADRVADGPLDLVESLVVAASVADALDHVHRAGVVHGGVSPTNVLFDGDGRAHLSDVGVAVVSDSPHVSDTGFTVSAAPYLAPEQVRGEEVGPAADLYALGLVLLEALTGRPAFAGAPLDAARARLDTAPTVPTDLPADVAALLRRLTDVDPVARPRADEVTVGLRRAALASEPEPDLPVVPLPRTGSPAVRARGLVVVGGLALSALLAGTVVFASTRPVDQVVSATTPPSAAAVPSVTAAAPPAVPSSSGLSSGSSSSAVGAVVAAVSAPDGGGSGGHARAGSASGPGSPTVARPPSSRSSSASPTRSTSSSSSSSSSRDGDRPSDSSDDRDGDTDRRSSDDDRNGSDGDAVRSDRSDDSDGGSSDREIQALPRVGALLDGVTGDDD